MKVEFRYKQGRYFILRDNKEVNPEEMLFGLTHAERFYVTNCQKAFSSSVDQLSRGHKSGLQNASMVLKLDYVMPDRGFGLG